MTPTICGAGSLTKERMKMDKIRHRGAAWLRQLALCIADWRSGRGRLGSRVGWMLLGVIHGLRVLLTHGLSGTCIGLGVRLVDYCNRVPPWSRWWRLARLERLGGLAVIRTILFLRE